MVCSNFKLSAICLLGLCLRNTLAQEESAVQPLAEMGSYLKSRTQFDGVDSLQSISYLKLAEDQSLDLPIMSTGLVNEPLDFTIMLWLKLAETQSDSLQFLFALEGSVTCFATQRGTIMCDTYNRQKLEVASDQIGAGKWIHLVLSTKADTNEAYLLIHDNTKVLSADQGTGFPLIQNVPYGWSMCVGACQGEKGIKGGIREMVLRHSYVDPNTAFASANTVFTYQNDFKAYFRFTNDEERFTKDYFVDRTFQNFQGMPANSTFADLVGNDLIAQDVCPTTYKIKEFALFDQRTRLRGVNLGVNLPQTEYQYTLSMTLYVNDTTCTTFDVNRASEAGCHIMLLDGVFMLYFEQSNMARFHFFARKNYFESQSKAFFLPNDQWVTLQMTMGHWKGYRIVLLDQNGAVLYSLQTNQNMQEMLPGGSLSLFNSLVGSVSDFRLCQDLTNIPVASSEITDDCLFILDFSRNGINPQLVKNQGSLGDVEFADKPLFRWSHYDVKELGANSTAGLYSAEKSFDGIACNDGHLNLRLDGPDSSLRFRTPPQPDWMSEYTVEFWFKPDSDEFYTEKRQIFSLNNMEEDERYFLIYSHAGELVCAPFGLDKPSNPVAVITGFTKDQEDRFGWWHISCSYSFRGQVLFNLYNEKNNKREAKSINAEAYFMPKDSLVASFGKPIVQGMLSQAMWLKEVRIWSELFQANEIALWRYRQVDPTQVKPGSLLTYLRLANGQMHASNFAEVADWYDFKGTNPVLVGASVLPDSIQEIQYLKSEETGEYQPTEVVTYHTVCPLYTYFNNDFCYSEPVNQLMLTVTPKFDYQYQTLDWVFSIQHSSAIDQSILGQLTQTWTSNDQILQHEFDAENALSPLRSASSAKLRQFGNYDVSVRVANQQLTFSVEDSITFVPNNCQWFEVSGYDAVSAYEIVNDSPGAQDIVYEMVLRKNPTLECSTQSFYPDFESLDFTYLLSDGVEYLEAVPKATYDYYLDPITKQIVLKVTIPASEQYKFPVEQDVKIVMTIHYTNNLYADIIPSQSLVFQNVIYTVRFKPAASQLVATLTANTNEVFAGGILILDASDSFITNKPESQSKRNILFEWICPEEIADLCEGQFGNILEISWSDVANHNSLQYNTTYTIECAIMWVRGTGDVITEIRNETVVWQAATTPSYTLDYTPNPVLVTSQTDTMFTIRDTNIADGDWSAYDVSWVIDPPLVDASGRQIYSGGKILSIEAGSWSPNTNYTVSVSVKNREFGELEASQQVMFATKAPPTNGTVTIDPPSGEVGNIFDIFIDGWITENPPIEYNVYLTLDRNGDLRGSKLNGMPIYQEELFQFVSENEFPVLVEIFDASQERVRFYLQPDFSVPEEDTSSTNSTTNETADDPVFEGNPQTSQNETTTEEVSPDSQPAEEPAQEDTTPEPAAEEPPTTEEPAAEQPAEEDPAGPDSSVRLSSIVNRIGDYTNQAEDQLQAHSRETILAEIQTEVRQFRQQQPTSGAISDLSLNVITMLKSITANSAFNNEVTAQVSLAIVDELLAMHEQAPLHYEASVQFHNDYMQVLESVIAMAHEQDLSDTETLALQHVTKHMVDEATSGVLLGHEGTEFAFKQHEFGQTDAALDKTMEIQVLDAEYTLDARHLISLMPGYPNDLVVQVLAVRSPEAYSSQLQVQVLDRDTGLVTQINELDSVLEASFAIAENTYIPNQTVCQGKSQGQWAHEEVCLTTVVPENFQITCHCNMDKVSAIALVDDKTRRIGEPVEFPLLVSGSEPAHMQGATYVYLSVFLSISLFGLIGSMVSLKADKADWATVNEALKTHKALYLEKCAEILQQPIELVQLRQHSLMGYQIAPNAKFLFFTLQMHPLVAPFTSFDACQSRLLRFNAYLLQLSVFSIAVIAYFGQNYRSDDLRDTSVLDQTDVWSVSCAVAIGGLVLLPLPGLSVLGNTIEQGETNYLVRRRLCTRVSFIALASLASILTSVFAGYMALLIPEANKYLAATAVVCGLFVATLVTNLLFVAIQLFLSACCRPLVSSKALEIVGDMAASTAAVKALSLETKQNTLTDEASIEVPQTETAVKGHTHRQSMPVTPVQSSFEVIRGRYASVYHTTVKPGGSIE